MSNSTNDSEPARRLINPGKYEATIEHIIIPCKHDFAKTKVEVERLIPELDMSPIKNCIDAGDHNGALVAMESLPALLIFDIRPRNVGAFLPHFSHTKRAAQYSIGNPLTAMRMTQLQVGAGLYPPFRVLLHESDSEDNAPVFEYIRPGSLVAHLQNSKIDEIAEGLDHDIEQALVSAAGWKDFGEWGSK